MASVIDLDEPALRIPARALSLAGFRAWATSDEFPEKARISYLGGELFIDMSPEAFETHNKIKTTVTGAISRLNERLDLGELYSDGTLLTNVAADLSTEPDATFVTWASFEAGRVRLKARRGLPDEFVELVGTPDWVLEVVSRNSVVKDTEFLRAAYHRAGIPEYWLIDARYDEIDFQLLRRRRDRYVAVAPRGGWRHSPTFGRGFRLERRRNRMGRWTYTLRTSTAGAR